ncbi:sensor histidine kinase [Dellaglioa sp. L3N]
MFIQAIVIWSISLIGANIILIYLISIEMLVATLYFFIRKHSIEQLPAVLFVFLLLALGIQLSELLLFKIMGLSYITQESNFFWICINTINPILFSLSTSRGISYLYRQYKLDSGLLKNHDSLKISSLMLSMIIIFFITIIKSDNLSNNRSNSLITNSALLMLIITITCIIFIISWIYRNKTLEKLRYEKIINNQLKEYLSSLEELENTQRQFRHDFINIYGSLSGYIEDNDMAGLKKYYYKEIEHINSEQNKKSFQLKSLTNMKIIELKGLLSLKITKADTLGISINIEIVNPVTDLPINLFDFNRCIGILLDNALEETSKRSNPSKVVDVVIFSEKNKITFFIKNTVSQNINIDTIFTKGYSTKGYSTKGAHRGIGLSEVERIINEAPNMSLETTIENMILTQKIIILKEA